MRHEAGCIRNANCFLYFHFGDPVNGESNWLSLTPFVNAQGLQTPDLQVHVPTIQRLVVKAAESHFAWFCNLLQIFWAAEKVQ